MNNLESLIFYIIMFSVSAIIITKVGSLYKRQESQRNKVKIIILTIIGIGIPIIIGAIRYRVGTDYENYMIIYNNKQNIDILQGMIQENERFFFLIIKIAAFFNNYQVMFAIITFLTVIIYYKAILNYKEKVSLGFTFFLYLFLNFTESFNVIRQALAVAIVFYSYKFVLNRNFVKFLLTVIIATMFHITALIFIPFYFICSNKQNETKKIKAIKVCAVIMVVFLVFNYADLINSISTNVESFERYGAYANEKITANRETIMNFAILIFILLFRKKLIRYDYRNNTLIFLYFIGFLFSLTGYSSAFVKRVAMYFDVSGLILLATFPQIVKNSRQKALIYFLLILYAIGIFTISTYGLGQGNILPYQTIFLTYKS